MTMKSLSNLWALAIGSVIVLGRELRQTFLPGTELDKWTIVNILLIFGLFYVTVLAVCIIDAALFGR